MLVRGQRRHLLVQLVQGKLFNIYFKLKSALLYRFVHWFYRKTTISRLLFRFYDPLSGTVEFDNMDIKKYQQKSVRACVGIVPQDTVLFNDTIYYNVNYGRLDASREEVENAARSAQILDFIESLPNGWLVVAKCIVF